MKGKTLICMSLSHSGRHFQGICGNQEWEMPCNVFYPDDGRERLPDIQGVVSYPGAWGIPGSLPVRHKTRIAKRHLTWKGS